MKSVIHLLQRFSTENNAVERENIEVELNIAGTLI